MPEDNLQPNQGAQQPTNPSPAPTAPSAAAPAVPTTPVQPAQANPGPATTPGQPTATPPPDPNQAPKAHIPSNPNSVQNSLFIAEIRDGMAIMKDGGFRAIIECESINFDLMSQREREGVEYSYQNLLNSLSFPIQILVNSRRVDIGPYLDELANYRRDQDNMLLNVLMDDYMNFIDILSQEANIMEKSFYVIVPYTPKGDLSTLVTQSKGIFQRMFSKGSTDPIKIDAKAFQEIKDGIIDNVNVVLDGLFQIGVQGRRLNTEEIGEVLYKTYNPDIAAREPLTDFNNVSSLYVRKGTGQEKAK